MLDKIVIFFLNAISIIFKLLSFINLTIRGIRKKRIPGCYVISVDNLAFGGTGKTPMVIMLTETLQKAGFPVAVVTRGYRSRSEKAGLRVGVEHDATTVGDEPLLLKRRLPEAEVFVGKDRLHSIEAAVRLGCRLIVLDDGFQSTHIRKDFSVLLFNPDHPYYYLRNFRFLARREDVILSYGIPSENRYGSGNYWFVLDGFHDVSEERVDVGDCGIVGFSALGDNDRFQSDLMAHHCVGFRGFPDHHAFTTRDIEELDALRQALHADYLVCTEKDFMKIQALSFGEIPLIFVKNSIKLDVDLIGQILDDAKTKGFF